MKAITTSSNIAPGTAGSWQDVDVSGLVPVGATGLVIRIKNTSTSYRYGGVRPNGSLVEMYEDIQHTGGGYVTVVKLDANRIFEARIESSSIEIYAIGYTEPNEVYFPVNPINVAPTPTSGFQTIDLSAHIQAGDTPTAGLFNCAQYQEATVYFKLRAYGSTDDLDVAMDTTEHTDLIRKLDGTNKSVQVYFPVAFDPWIAFVGYWKASNAVFSTDATNVSPGSTGTWTDLTALPVPGAFGCYDGCSYGYGGYSARTGLRKNGTTDAFQALASAYDTDAALFPSSMVSESDNSGIIEGWKESADEEIHYYGYIGPMASDSHPLLLTPF